LVNDLAAGNTEDRDFMGSRQPLRQGMLIEDIPFSILNDENNT
jgi:hypothetical protein